jgi:hypothetical protein
MMGAAANTAAQSSLSRLCGVSPQSLTRIRLSVFLLAVLNAVASRSSSERVGRSKRLPYT